MRVLVACEFSGIVRDAFLARGHDALSCDLLPTEKPGPHFQGDVREIIGDDWDLMIGHPPCTFLTNSGALRLYMPLTEADREAGLTKRYLRDEERWDNMYEAADFFNYLWSAPIPRIALENPIMHGHAAKETGGKATQYIQPYEFGHLESKRTGLRLKNLPPLVPVTDLKEEMMAQPLKVRQRILSLSPGPNRWKDRSRTYTGIAEAMADQWGDMEALPPIRAEEPALQLF